MAYTILTAAEPGELEAQVRKIQKAGFETVGGPFAYQIEVGVSRAWVIAQAVDNTQEETVTTHKMEAS